MYRTFFNVKFKALILGIRCAFYMFTLKLKNKRQEQRIHVKLTITEIWWIYILHKETMIFSFYINTELFFLIKRLSPLNICVHLYLHFIHTEFRIPHTYNYMQLIITDIICLVESNSDMPIHLSLNTDICFRFEKWNKKMLLHPKVLFLDAWVYSFHFHCYLNPNQGRI